MAKQNYQQLIAEGIKELPQEALAEIVDFIYFLRKRVLQPQAFEEELRNLLLDKKLHQLSQEEEAHLEKEFENYRQVA